MQGSLEEVVLSPKILSEYEIGYGTYSVVPLIRGHLNRTFVIERNSVTTAPSILLQQINEHVFGNITALMANISKVCATLGKSSSYNREATPLTLLRTQNGEPFTRDEDGNPWRAFRYLSGRLIFDQCPSEDVAWAAGRLCALFLSSFHHENLSGFSETIPFFQNLTKRFIALKEASLQDVMGRLRVISSEVASLLNLAEHVAGITDDPALPIRLCHNDFKLNNLLFVNPDKIKGDAVVDLDTCMPGAITYDIGDMLRSIALERPEDEPDITTVHGNHAIISACISGFMEVIGDNLTPTELYRAADSPRAVSLALAARFYTDYLNGDRYFRVEDPEQNLRRARVYVKLATELYGLMKDKIIRRMILKTS